MAPLGKRHLSGIARNCIVWGFTANHVEILDNV